MPPTPYDRAFMRERADDAATSAPVVVRLVKEALGHGVTSVIDVGCGSGGWLREFASRGAEILGVDGDYAWDGLVIASDRFQASDLSQPLLVDRRFHLAVCLEVAEHLPEARGPALVAELCQLADAVLFSAAIPGQDGEHHVNLRWQSYWAGLFRAQGFGVRDCVRAQVWEDRGVQWWYAQNAFLYQRGAEDLLTMPLDVVHPGMARATILEPTVSDAARALHRALRRSGRFRIGRLRAR